MPVSRIQIIVLFVLEFIIQVFVDIQFMRHGFVHV